MSLSPRKQLLEKLDEQIEELRVEIGVIDSRNVQNPEPQCVIDCCAALKVQLEAKKLSIEAPRARLQQEFDTLEAGWDKEKQSVVDAINTRLPDKHTVALEQLLLGDADKCAKFFAAYGEVEKDDHKDLILKMML